MGSGDDTYDERMAAFEGLWFEVAQAEIDVGSLTDLEPLFERLLNFIETNPDLTEAIKGWIVTALGDRQRALPFEAIAYCMRVLRWPEVEARCKVLIRDEDWRVKAVMSDLLKAYAEHWDQEEVFASLRRRPSR